MEQDPTRICELLVGLGDVDVLGVNDEPAGPLVVGKLYWWLRQSAV